MVCVTKRRPEQSRSQYAQGFATAYIESMKHHIACIREETNDTIHEGSVKHSCTNLRNALDYWDRVDKSLKLLEIQK